MEERSLVPVEEALRTDPDRGLLTAATVVTRLVRKVSLSPCKVY